MAAVRPMAWPPPEGSERYDGAIGEGLPAQGAQVAGATTMDPGEVA